MRAIHDGIFYRVDGDCFGLSEAGAVAAEKNLQWLDLIARSGTALFVSWKRELTTPESREALEKALRRAARVQPLGEPLDWQETLRPAQWRFGEETVEYRW
jgi:alpha-galactosidase